MRLAPILSTAVLAASLASCAAPDPNRYRYRDLTPEEAAAVNMQVTCTGKEACDRMWRKATAWIVANSGYKLQVATDSVVQTFGPGNGPEVAYTLTRRPVDRDRDEFVLVAGCRDYGFGCTPQITAAKARAHFVLHMLEP